MLMKPEDYSCDLKYPKSILELGRVFKDDDCCLEYLYNMRFPDGFVCSECGGKEGYPVPERKAIKCAECAKWTYLTEGTDLPHV